jgi:hypothetical protein
LAWSRQRQATLLYSALGTWFPILREDSSEFDENN